MSTTQLQNAKKIIDDNYEENPNSFLYDFCRNSFFCKEKFEEYLDAIGYLIAENLPEYINEGIITPLRERTNSYNSGFFNRDVFDYIIKNKHK